MKDSVDGSTAGVVLNFMKNGRIFLVTEFYDNGNAITSWIEKDGSRTLSNKDMKSSAALFTGNRLSITNIQNYLFNVKGAEKGKYSITEEEDVKYSVDESFEKQIDRINNEDETFKLTHLYAGNTPEYLGKFGFDTSKPLLITGKHVHDIMTAEDGVHEEFHGLSKTDILNAVKEISDPVMVIASQKNDGSIIVVTSVIDQRNRPVIVSLLPDGKGRFNGIFIDANIIKSMYGRNNVMNFILRARDENRILDINKKRSQQLTKNPGVQFPNVTSSIDFKANIASYKDLVKGTDKSKEKYSISDEESIPPVFEDVPEGWDMTQVYYAEEDESPKPKMKFTTEIVLPKYGESRVLPRGVQYDIEDDPLGKFTRRDSSDPREQPEYNDKP